MLVPDNDKRDLEVLLSLRVKGLVSHVLHPQLHILINIKML